MSNEQPEIVTLAAPSPADAATVASQTSSHPAATDPYRVVHHHEVLTLMQTTLSFLIGALFVLTFVVQPYRIPSGSMQDTLLIGDFLLVNKTVLAPPGPWRHLLAYHPVRRGNIVVCHDPIDPSMYLVKRVVGLPNDRLRMHGGRVLIDGKLLAEPYALYIKSYPSTFRDEFPTPVYTDPGVGTQWWMLMRHDVHAGELWIPPGEYFVLGDNRNDSLDSRYWGFVPRQNIVGEPLLVYFSIRSPGRSEITGLFGGPSNARGSSSDRLAHKHSWWNNLAGSARWNRIFHVIR